MGILNRLRVAVHMLRSLVLICFLAGSFHLKTRDRHILRISGFVPFINRLFVYILIKATQNPRFCGDDWMGYMMANLSIWHWWFDDTPKIKNW